MKCTNPQETLLGQTNIKIKDKEIIHYVANDQIGASSCSPNFEPFRGRLNNPKSCWKPSANEKYLNNSWICVDFCEKRMITKLRLQGSPNGNECYVKSVWIDYSDDGTEWQCHNTLNAHAQIECEYVHAGDDEDGQQTDAFAEMVLRPLIDCKWREL